MTDLAWDWIILVAAVGAVLGVLFLAGGLNAPATVWRMVLMVGVALTVVLIGGRYQSRAIKRRRDE